MVSKELARVFQNIHDNVDGCFMEFGVFRGVGTKYMLSFATMSERMYYGFDSFEGMSEPTEKDIMPDGKSPYPRGRLNSGGYTTLKKDIEKAGYVWEKDFLFIKGFVSDTVKEVQDVDKVAFAYIDLDQYQPTIDAFNYVGPRISAGGYILFDDYIKTRNYLAAGAINKILDANQDEFEVIREGKFYLSDKPCNQILVKVKK